MIMGRRMKWRIVIETPNELDTGTDEFGNEDESILDYWTASEHRALVVPAGSSENETDRETLTRGFDVYVDPQTPVNAFCRVRLRPPGVDQDEVLCRVIGEPRSYQSTTGRISHKSFRAEVIV
jgi:hypothetical protein